MPSAFEGVARSVLLELDRHGELIPVDSLRNATSFKPYCLLSRKPSTSWFWKSRYEAVNLSIRDILEPDGPEPEVQRGKAVHFHDMVDGQLQGSVGLSSLGQGKISGGATVSRSSSASMDVCSLRVDPSVWEVLQKERHLRKPEHKLLQQLRNQGVNVFVVTEVLQTQQEVVVRRTRKQEGSGHFSLQGAVCLQGQGQGHLNWKKTVTIPSGSTLAFQVAQLVIDSDWDIIFFLDGRQTTFREPLTTTGLHPQSAHLLPPSFFSLLMQSIRQNARLQSDGLEGWSLPTEDFTGLRTEVETQAEFLKPLSCGLRRQLCRALESLLPDMLALKALEEALEQGLSSKRVEPRDSPEGAVLECLVLHSRELARELTAPIYYLLGALTALTETQHLLLAQALSTRSLSGHLELVESLLVQSSPWQVTKDVSLPLGSSWCEDTPCWVLLEECDLELQVDAPQVCWKPQAQGPTCALYAALVVLSILAQEP
ncbi:gasdermin-D isoform X1 [Tenrec ecaudatus]|uniref:gasdermin-D isoform X1 n=1 Tax=Tenrec ecaudatus TaxID=94439 RepID=UPI003F5A34C2